MHTKDGIGRLKIENHRPSSVIAAILDNHKVANEKSRHQWKKKRILNAPTVPSCGSELISLPKKSPKRRRDKEQCSSSAFFCLSSYLLALLFG